MKKNALFHWVWTALLRSILVILLVTTAVFFIIRLVPGDPAVMVLGEHASEESIEALRHKMNLDMPAGQQFAAFVKNVITRADTGDSLKYNVSSRELIFKYLPVTLTLVGLCLLITVTAVVLLAMAAAVLSHRGRLRSR